MDSLHAQTDPVVPGFIVSTYANVTDARGLSFDPAGNLYVGRDNSGSGGGDAEAVRIHRVGRHAGGAGAEPARS
jgi:hypothetical protein